jgi:putative ABC transport system substrate-binding protein
MPTIFPRREYVIDGGLLSYGTSLRNSYREMAGYVGRILNGAKALALTIPTSILLRADEVIE